MPLVQRRTQLGKVEGDEDGGNAQQKQEETSENAEKGTKQALGTSKATVAKTAPPEPSETEVPEPKKRPKAKAKAKMVQAEEPQEPQEPAVEPAAKAAKTAPKSRKRKTAETNPPEDEQNKTPKTEKEEKKENSTFAGRYCPAGESKPRWLAIRDVFMKEIQPKAKFTSKMQARHVCACSCLCATRLTSGAIA